MENEAQFITQVSCGVPTQDSYLQLTPLRAKTKVTHVLIREMLFADNAPFTFHTCTEDGLRQLLSRLSHACKEFDLTISVKKTDVMAQDSDYPPAISVDGHILEVVENFTYLGSTISITLNIKVEMKNRIFKAVAVMARLTKRVWNNSTRHVCSALISMAVRHGLPTRSRRRN